MLSIAFGILYGSMDYFKIEYTRDSLLYLYLISLISNIGLIFWAFQLDIRDPRLQEYASTKNASDHKNSQRILTFGIVFALILTLVFAILNFNSLSHSYIVLLGISVVFLIARVLIFRANLYVFFEEIEL